jgi:hypothetical protein
MNTNSDKPRLLNEAEVRSAAHLLLVATTYARRAIGEWLLSKSKPKQDEML